jgi:hypothetical protein
MMPGNLFQEKDRKKLLQRLGHLHPQAPRKWGCMQVEQMVWHLRIQLELALGMRPDNFRWHYLSIPPIRWIALYAIRWPKGSRTPEPMKVNASTHIRDLHAELTLLLLRLEEVSAAKTLKPHPHFGKMSKDQWGRLIWKHIDHHLRQFGV